MLATMASLPILVAIGAGVPSGAGSVTGPGAPESALPFIALPPTGPVIVPPAPTPSDEPAAAHAAPGLPANRRPVKRDARRPGAIGKRPEQPRQPAPTESAPAPRPPVPTTLPPEPTHPPSHQPTPWWPPVPHPTLPQLPRPPHPPSHMPSWPALPGSLCPTP